MLSPARGQITHVLLTRAPLYRGRSPFSCDLHVLGAPLTFALSQDQTLQLISCEDRNPRLIDCEHLLAFAAICCSVWSHLSRDAPCRLPHPIRSGPRGAVRSESGVEHASTATRVSFL